MIDHLIFSQILASGLYFFFKGEGAERAVNLI